MHICICTDLINVQRPTHGHVTIPLPGPPNSFKWFKWLIQLFSWINHLNHFQGLTYSRSNLFKKLLPFSIDWRTRSVIPAWMMTDWDFRLSTSQVDVRREADNWAQAGAEFSYRCEAHHTLRAFSWLTEKQPYLTIPPDTEKLQNISITTRLFCDFSVLHVWGYAQVSAFHVMRRLWKCGDLHTGSWTLGRRKLCPPLPNRTWRGPFRAAVAPLLDHIFASVIQGSRKLRPEAAWLAAGGGRNLPVWLRREGGTCLCCWIGAKLLLPRSREHSLAHLYLGCVMEKEGQ